MPVEMRGDHDEGRMFYDWEVGRRESGGIESQVSAST